MALGGLVACAAQANLDQDAGSPPLDSGAANDGNIVFQDSQPPPPIACADTNTKLVFVLTEDFQLLRFDPSTVTFTVIGTVACPVPTGTTTFSMAIDHFGTAWVIYEDGELFFVSTSDASCKPSSSYIRNQDGFAKFGMAFAADAPMSTSETLYIMDSDTPRIGKLDTTTLLVSEIGKLFDDSTGPYPLPLGDGELTGTGAATLYGFYANGSAYFSQVDTTTGAAVGIKNIVSLQPAGGLAFAQWGGSFWLFTGLAGKSTVTKYDYTSNTATTVASGLPWVMDGAGVSTCAPTVPPN